MTTRRNCGCLSAELPGYVHPMRRFVRYVESGRGGRVMILADKDCPDCGGTGYSDCGIRISEFGIPIRNPQSEIRNLSDGPPPAPFGVFVADTAGVHR